MKKILIVILMLGVSFVSTAQNFEKYEEMADVNGVFITENMFKLLSKLDIESDKEDQQYFEMIKSLEGLKVLSTTNSKIGSEMKTDAEKYISSGGLEELMRVKNDGKSLKFYSKPGNSEEKIRQLFMFMTQDEDTTTRYVLLSLTGNIDLNKVGELSGKLKGVPGAEDLKNIKSK